MGNRSFLYLTGTPQARDKFRLFAEANNNLPTLWQVILADSKSAPPIKYQRVFGDANTDNLSSEAAGAFARIERLAEAVGQHPLLHTVAALPQQFEGLLAYLRDEMAAVGSGGGEPVVFSADLDELSWLGQDDDFIKRIREDSNRLWADIDRAIANGDYPALDEALGLNANGGNFSQWPQWAYTFGFAGLDHPYFTQRDEPQKMPFAEFAPEERDVWLGEGLELIQKDKRQGVRLLASGKRGKSASRVLVKPEWEHIVRSGHTDTRCLWVRRDGRYGLLHANDDEPRLLHPCDLDSVWDFEDAGGKRIAAVLQNDLIGLIDENGDWVLAPQDARPPIVELWDFCHGLAPARSGEKTGAIDGSGRWVVQPQFDQIDEFNPQGYALAVRDGRHVLLNAADGTIGADTYSGGEWAERLPGFIVYKGNKQGWLHPDGRTWIAPEWDEIRLPLGDRFLVRRDKLWGALRHDGSPCIAPDYRALDERLENTQALQENNGRQEFIAKRDKHTGVIDDTGKTVIPFEYARIESFVSVNQPDGRAEVPGTLVRVIRRSGRRHLCGAWDLRLARETAVCRYDHIHATVLYRDAGQPVYGYLIANKTGAAPDSGDAVLRVGVLRSDGSELFAANWAWIAERYGIDDTTGALIVGRNLAKAWTDNRAVQAAVAGENRYAWLLRNGDTLTHEAWLTQCYAEGDFDAAWQLACHYRDGEGIEQNDALAKRWTALAAGMPADTVPTAPASRPGKPARKRASPWMSVNADPRGHPEAICELALLLDNDNAEEHDSAAARAWLEHALRHRGKDSASVHNELGYLLDAGRGGPADLERAAKLYRRAAIMNDVRGLYYLGWCYEFQRGVPADPAEAIKHYRGAARMGHLEADYRIGLLLRQQADATEGKARDQALREAAYHLRKAADTSESTVALAASAELALLILRGEGGQKRDAHGAERLLLAGAEQGDNTCIAYLVQHLYGDKESAKYDAAKSRKWKKQLGG